MSTKSLECSVLVVIALCGAGCNSESAKNATAAVIGKAVEVTKGTATGIAEGVEQGRKSGESADGALIVTGWKDLETHGGISVASVTPAGKDAPAIVTVTLVVENTSDKPMRVSDIELMGMDTSGFVMKPEHDHKPSLTVPPHAKDKVDFGFLGKDLKIVRVWGKDVPVSH